MTAKIYIASKSVDGTPFRHSYFVFDPDGNPNSGDEKVIRGGPPTSTGSEYVIEVDRDIASSRDALDGDDPYTDRHYTTVVEGNVLDVEASWNSMVAAATALGTIETDPTISGETVTTLAIGTYGLPAPDCNTLTGTLGNSIGLDVLANLPKVAGDTGADEREYAFRYPGVNSTFVSSGDDAVSLDPTRRAYFDQGGEDNYTIDPSTLALGQTINLFEDSDAGTVDKITLLNVDPADVHVVRGPNGFLDIFIEGRNTPIVTIQGQFDGSGVPKINTLIVEPPVGSPTSVPLVDPDNIPLYTPVPLPALISGEIQPAFASAISASSPLVIDLSSGHTGVTLTTWNAATTETFFDLNNNGFAVQTAWVSGDTGLLARDLNSNGTIDSSAELFGSPTVDGFAKLAALDSNHDLRIDNNDADWSTLVVWTDDNGDAVTQNGELHSLASLGIANIDLAGVASSTSTISGNPISHTSTVTFTGGATAAIADAWFIHDNTNSYYAGDYTLDAETLFLPALRGYGTLPDLPIAMSQDSDLKELVEDFAANFTLADIADASTSIEEILFTWAGVDSLSPSSRGPNVDARHLGLLEHLIGSEFLQQGLYSNPYGNSGNMLEQTYQKTLNMLSAQLLIQVGGSELFTDSVSYNAASGTFDGDLSLSETGIDHLATIAPAPGTECVAFWVAIGRFLEGTKSLESLTSTELGWLEAAVNASDSSLHWTNTSSIVTAEIEGSGTDDTLNGDSDPNIIHGNDGNDFIRGYDGDDTLYGDAGDDYVNGAGGADTLYGGDGNDSMFGESGDDTYYSGLGGNSITDSDGNDIYIHGGGDDIILEYGGTDQIVLPSGVTLGDLTFSRVSTSNTNWEFDDLLIQIEGAGSIQIKGHFYNASSAIETIVFSDASTLSLSSVTGADVRLTNGNDNFSSNSSASYTAYGYDGNDTIFAGGTGAHTMDGGNGNDLLKGGSSSNDTYIASTGFDTIQENNGTDTIVIPAGFTIDDVTFYRILGVSGPTNDLGISINGLGEIKVTSQFYGASHAVENMHFLEDSTTISLTGMTITTVGTASNDTLRAPSANVSANDILDGREGNDSLYGGAGDDTYIFSSGHDTIYETSGSNDDDTIKVRDIYTTADISIYFDASADLQLMDSDGNNMTVYRQTQAAFYGIEHIVFADSTSWDLANMGIETRGTSAADYLYGKNYGDASSEDTIYGYDGDDHLYGDIGDDVLFGGNDNDSLRGDGGNDLLYGGDGDDTIFASSNDGDDTVHGDAGDDTIYGVGHSFLYGDDGGDELHNNASSINAATTLVTLNGGSGADDLYGGYGQTIMDGGSGADTLNSVVGSTETFKFGSDAFGSVDTIKQFRTTSDHDKLDISDILDGHFDPLTQVSRISSKSRRTPAIRNSTSTLPAAARLERLSTLPPSRA